MLILDDDEDRHEEFRRVFHNVARKHVYTAAQAIRALRNSPPFDLVCLDHDLEKSAELINVRDPGNGTQVALFINQRLDPDHYPRRVLIHSKNPVRPSRMAALISAVGIPVTVKPFHG